LYSLVITRKFTTSCMLHGIKSSDIWDWSLGGHRIQDLSANKFHYLQIEAFCFIVSRNHYRIGGFNLLLLSLSDSFGGFSKIIIDESFFGHYVGKIWNYFHSCWGCIDSWKFSFGYHKNHIFYFINSK
jgi:hypothetical protein